jgi:hypothetical protein
MQNDRNCASDLCSGALKRVWAVYQEYSEDSSGKEKLLCVEDVSNRTFKTVEGMDDKERGVECLTTDSSTLEVFQS